MDVAFDIAKLGFNPPLQMMLLSPAYDKGESRL